MGDDAAPRPLSGAAFLEVLFGTIPDGWLEILYLAGEAMPLIPRTVVSWRALPLGTVDPALSGVMRANERGYGAYFGVAVRAEKIDPEERVAAGGQRYRLTRRGRATDARWLTALWVDVDEVGDSGYRRCIGALGAPPSLVVSSGGGWHGYWLLTEPLCLDRDDREMVKRTLKGMALAAGSDTRVADLARVMRIPGTVNTKPGRDGKRCEVVDYLPCRYRYREFEQAFAPLSAPPTPIRRNLPVSASAGLPHWCESYLRTGARRGERNTKAYAAARAMLDNGVNEADMEQAIRTRALADGLEEREVESLLRSAIQSPRAAPYVPDYMALRMSSADKRWKG